jgi:hypothetical protein
MKNKFNMEYFIDLRMLGYCQNGKSGKEHLRLDMIISMPKEIFGYAQRKEASCFAVSQAS